MDRGKRAERVTMIMMEESERYKSKASGYGDAISISAQIVALLLSNIPDERFLLLMKTHYFRQLLGLIYRIMDKFIRIFK